MDIEGNGPTLIIQVGLGKDDGWGAKQKMQRERMSKTRDAGRPAGLAHSEDGGCGEGESACHTLWLV